jgi:hypothetical protein
VSCAQRWSRAGCTWSSITGRLFAVGTPRPFVAQPRARENGEDQATRPSVHQNSEEIGSTNRFIVRPGRLEGSRSTTARRPYRRTHRLSRLRRDDEKTRLMRERVDQDADQIG